MNYILEIEQLRLIEFTIVDTAVIVELVNSPEWLKFIRDRNRRQKDKVNPTYETDKYNNKITEKA